MQKDCCCTRATSEPFIFRKQLLLEIQHCKQAFGQIADHLIVRGLYSCWRSLLSSTWNVEPGRELEPSNLRAAADMTIPR